MAEFLTSIFATEKDQVNCPFYFNICACRHGNHCSRHHIHPIISPTLIFHNMYQPPDSINIQHHVDDFFKDVYMELSKYGEIETLKMCDNLVDHMHGNVYVLFEEDQAAAALNALRGGFSFGRPIIADFSHVTDFSEATCRLYEEGSCDKGKHCNFMHVKMIGMEIWRKLFGRSSSRSRSPAGGNDRDDERRGRSPVREGNEERASE